MDESTIEITQEERERVIANIKSVNKAFFGEKVAKAIQADYNNDNECWAKLLALIESAPAKRNMKAAELADKLEQTYEKTLDVIKTVKEVFGYDISDTPWNEDLKHLIDVLRNLDAPEDCMQWPLDKDGIEIKPGDTVYIGEDEYAVAYIEYGVIGVGVRLVDSSSLLLRNPRDLTHKKPRTLDDIKDEIYDLTFECDTERVSKLIDEIYEIGKVAKDE